MKSFLKYTLATITGIIISTFLIMIVFLGILGAMMAASDKPVTLESNSILHLKVNQDIPDRTPLSPIQFDPITFTISSRVGLNDILKNLEKAREDPNIKGIYLESGFVAPGISTVEELRNALIDFKSSGKFIIAYANEVMPQSFYYLASVADKVYLNPVAIFEFVGLRSEVMFYKGAFDKLGVDMQIIRHGEFKSAVEPYVRKDMSSQNKEQIFTYIQSVWEHMLIHISDSRDIPVDTLNQLADELAIQLPGDAVAYGLVDAVKYHDEIIDELKGQSGIESDKNLRLVSMTKYSRVPKDRGGKGLAKDKIAIVYATGIIGLGEGSETSIGGSTFIKAFRAVRKDTNIKAIVLRINSPGGSAMVSEHLWREISMAAEAKPLVVSMGNLAASGGYYIAAPADVVIAHPTTLTGSIGVLATIPNLQTLMNDKLGLTFDVVKTNEYADFGSIYRPLKPGEEAFLINSIEHTYDTFLERVSNGRHLEKTYVDEIGQGRIWGGIKAKEIGLIDEFGGLQTAIELASDSCGIEEYRIVEYPKFEDPFEKLLKSLSGDILIRYQHRLLGTYYQIFQEVEEISKTRGVQAMLPFHFEMY